jgi:transcriptional regulator with XRE-family HTH domain
MTTGAGRTVRRRRLAHEMLQFREDARLTREEVAERMDWHPTKLWRIETARSGVTTADLRHLLEIYGVTEIRRRDALIALARNARQRGWWTSYGDALAGSYVPLEAEATSIRTYEPTYIPGLLQTEDYTRAVMRVGLYGTPDEIDRRVTVRMMRQQLHKRDEPPALWAVIDEAALRRPVGGRDVMCAQLDHLIEMSERSHVRLQVLPLSVGAHPSMGGAFVILDYAAEPSIIYLETPTDGLYLEKREQIDRYNVIFDDLRAEALGPDASLRFIATVSDEIK